MAKEYSYTAFEDLEGSAFVRPIIPMKLTLGGRSIDADALLDTGSDANVLPYQLGLELGLKWGDAAPFPGLSGNLSKSEARAIILDVSIDIFDPVRMIFVWIKADTARLLLGQVNFFREFNVCFYAPRGFFEVNPKD